LPFPVMDNLRKIGAFVVRSVVIGLALAFVVVWLRPDVFPRPDARETSYAAAVAEAAPTVVNVHIARRIPMRSPLLDDPFNLLPVPDRLETSLGSGVIVDSRGYILTNHHVIAGAD